MAMLAVPESRLITIQPWDVSGIKEIEKAILKSDLGLTPSSDGKIVRIAIPPLTEERRKDLIKVVKREASATIKTLPARYETIQSKVLVREASKKIEIIPAEYDTVTEEVVIKPASFRLEQVPAVYETVSEKVMECMILQRSCLFLDRPIDLFRHPSLY